MHAAVAVHYGGASNTFSDTGLITYLDRDWLELTKDNGDVLLVPVTAIRIVKVLQFPSNEERTLLRSPDATEIEVRIKPK